MFTLVRTGGGRFVGGRYCAQPFNILALLRLLSIARATETQLQIVRTEEMRRVHVPSFRHGCALRTPPIYWYYLYTMC